jgi:hypothetical protein
MRQHAGDSEHLYGHLMRAMADDWDAGGPVRQICAGWEDAPAGWVIQLRLLAGLFRIVLTGRAPELEAYYPCLGGYSDPALAWPAARVVLAEHTDELREALEIAPQTNEVGRANALLVGIFRTVRHTGRSRIRLLEPGSSAGLNLLVDRFRFVNQGWDFGPADAPVVLAGGVVGRVDPAPFTIIERRGCDLSPIDVTSEQGRLRLRSFVWPFDVDRHERLSGALRLAGEEPPRVDRDSAASWLEVRLAEPVDDDVVTVVWQSITRQYWPRDEVERVDGILRQAAERISLAHVSMEYPDLTDAPTAVLSVSWMDDAAEGSLRLERVGTVGDHGFPTIIDAV